MTTLFHIPAADNKKSNVLLGELGSDYCCLALADSTTKTLHGLTYYSLDKKDTSDAVASLFEQQAGAAAPEKVVLCSAYAEALLVPQKLFREEQKEAFLGSMYHTAGYTVKHDAIAEWQVHTVYALPADVLMSIAARNQNLQLMHTYTTTLKVHNGFVAEGQVSVYFTPRHFRAVLKKSGQVYLAQTYSYSTPLDVVYYLLKIYETFGLEQGETHIIVSGLIGGDSALFKELYNYFLNIHFAQPPANKLTQNEHPHYFFHSIYNLAACVL